MSSSSGYKSKDFMAMESRAELTAIMMAYLTNARELQSCASWHGRKMRIKIEGERFHETLELNFIINDTTAAIQWLHDYYELRIRRCADSLDIKIDNYAELIRT